MIYFLIGTIIVSTILILCYKTNRSNINLAEEEKTRREEMELNLNKEFQNRREEQDKYLSQELTIKKQSIQNEIDDWTKSAQEAASFNQYLQEQKENEYLNDLKNSEQDLYNNIEQLINQQKEINSQLEDAKQSIATYNEAIVQQRKIQEEKDFYRIQLSDLVTHDIQILNSIRSELSKIDNFDKFVYDIYVKKFVDEMIKRVVNGRKVSGIYRITRLKTGEMYIGQSVDIATRWAGHTKAVYHTGTVSYSSLHRTMAADGIENFTWEILEEVPKDRLNTREKYWIQFYDTKNYGLNEKL